jgi:hypothetical protein
MPNRTADDGESNKASEHEAKRVPPNRPAQNEQGICIDERGQDQPEDKDRAQRKG